MNNKKYGLIVFNKTKNLGDDIQSYAAIRYLPQIDYYIEREKLNEFISDDGEIVNTIMNGWYMHDITSMPPSPFINPLFISIHLTDHLYNKKPEYLSEYFIEYLKKYQPIGCRDNVIRKYLTENDIDNYFSGCLTLTIQKFENVKKEDYICAVDLDDEELLHLKKITNKEIRIITHYMDDVVNSKLSYKERMKNVEKTLKIYQGASFVVTTRLHCALPSLALETPVLMIFNSKNIDENNRMGIFLEFLNYASKEEFLSGKCDSDIKNLKKNNQKYLDLRDNLINTTNEFIEKKSVNYQKNKEHANLYKKYFVDQKKYLIDIVEQKMEFDKKNLIKDLENEYKRREYEMNLQIDKYVLRQEVLAKELEVAVDNYSKVLSSITNSRGYRYLEKLRKIIRKLLRRDK